MLVEANVKHQQQQQQQIPDILKESGREKCTHTVHRHFSRELLKKPVVLVLASPWARLSPSKPPSTTLPIKQGL